jgi:hypothetical protein
VTKVVDVTDKTITLLAAANGGKVALLEAAFFPRNKKPPPRMAKHATTERAEHKEVAPDGTSNTRTAPRVKHVRTERVAHKEVTRALLSTEGTGDTAARASSHWRHASSTHWQKARMQEAGQRPKVPEI